MAEFKKGDLTVSLTNESTAYPTLPETGAQVTGTTRFAWYQTLMGTSRQSLGATGRTLAGRTTRWVQPMNVMLVMKLIRKKYSSGCKNWQQPCKSNI